MLGLSGHLRPARGLRYSMVFSALVGACAPAFDEAGQPIVHAAPSEDIGAAAQPLIDGMKYKPRTFGFVLVDIGGGVNLSKEEATKRLFGTNAGDKSVRQYYNEVSYGAQDISGEVLGPFNYAMNGRCDVRGVASALKPMLGKYDHYLWYMGSRNGACQFSGLAESGLPNRPTNDTWYNGSANCVVLVQEPGHNFGMQHSSSMACGTTPFADDPDATCKHSEYGDRYDPMGGACNHMNAWQKVFEGWLQKCNGITVNSSGMYALQPLELACDGPQVLQIPMPKVRPFGRSGGGGVSSVENIGFYYLELRTPRGFDDTIRSSPTILVHVAEDIRDRTNRGRHTWLLDMDPSTRTIDGLGMGQSYTDPAGGVSFQVAAISADSATIQVTLPDGTGPATCLDDTTYDPTVPLMCAGIVTPGGVQPSTPGTPTTMPGTMPVAPPRVEAFILVNADTGEDIRQVEDMTVLDLEQLPPNLTMRADTDPPMVGSVIFRIDAGAPITDNTAPYTVSTGRNRIAPWTLGLGAHTVNAVAFDAVNGGGRPGEMFEIDFTLTRSGALPVAGAAGAPSGAAGAPPGSDPPTGASAGGAGGAAGDPPLASSAGAAAPAGVPPGQPLTGKADCSCRTVGTGAGSAGTARIWTLLALAIGSLTWRRRARRKA